MATGSVMAERFFGFTGGRAPRRSATGLRSALPVAIAYRSTCPQFCSTRCEDSTAPRSATRLTVDRNSFAVISAIGLLPSQGKISFSSRSMILLACNATQVSDCFACHSRATTSKLFEDRSSPEAFVAFLCWLGSIPEASSLRAASRLSLASERPVSGNVPSDRRFSLPP